jgi:hypothetical protein
MKPLSDFHKDKSKHDGLTSTCKPCACQRTLTAKERRDPDLVQRRDAKREQELERERLLTLGLKRCCDCCEVKSVDCFYVHVRHADGFSGICKECSSKRCAAFYRGSSEKIKAGVRDWQTKNRERVRQTKAANYQRNREAISAAWKARYATDPELRRRNQQRVKRWCEENPERARELALAGVHARRARILGGNYEHVDRQKVFNRDGWVCRRCGKKVNKRLKWPHKLSATLDHIIPLALGGDHTYENVQLAHAKCNLEKSHTGAGDQLALLGGINDG